MLLDQQSFANNLIAMNGHMDDAIAAKQGEQVSLQGMLGLLAAAFDMAQQKIDDLEQQIKDIQGQLP